MNKTLFAYHQALNGDNRKSTAAILKVHPNTIGRRLKESNFSAKDIDVLRKRWHLSDEECRKIFLDSI